MNNIERYEQDQKHLHFPEIGDYWHEMLCGICVVLEVTPTCVKICQTKKQLSDGWTWDLEKVAILTRAQFVKRLSYDTIPDKTYCSVHPKSHMWSAEAYRNIYKKPTETEALEDEAYGVFV